MKKFIALAAALMVLLFGFAASAEIAVVENGGVQVCSDIDPEIEPYD